MRPCVTFIEPEMLGSFLHSHRLATVEVKMNALTGEARALLGALVSHLENEPVVANRPDTFIGYKQVHEVLGLPQIGKWGESLKRQGLNELAEWTKSNAFPAITGLIVDKQTLQPGDGYFTFFRGDTDYQWWADEIQKSIEFDWQSFLRQPVPTIPLPPATIIAVDIDDPPERELCSTYRILRDTLLARQVKQQHKYQCQVCGHTIELADGTRYAEAHHIRPLGQPHNGPDIIGNILCLCPNHHAELDYGAISLSLSSLRQVLAHPVDITFVDYHNSCIANKIA